MADTGPRAAWRITVDGGRLGFQAARAMPILLLSSVIIAIAIEAMDVLCGKAQGTAMASDAVPVIWSIARALLKGCLAASTEIAVYRFVLLGESADRPVWRTPPRFRRYIAVGLALGGAFAVVLNVLPYASTRTGSGSAIFVCLAFALLAVVALRRSVTLFRAIAGEASGRCDTAWCDIAPYWWKLVRVFGWHMAITMAAGCYSGHAGSVLLAVAGPYAFAASFALLYRELARGVPALSSLFRDAPAPAWRGQGVLTLG